MKTLRLSCALLVFIFWFTAFSTARASTAVSEEKATEMLQRKSSEQGGFASQVMSGVEKRFTKKMEKLQKRLAKKVNNGIQIDLNDPVNKWMWFWLIGWAAGILLYAVGIGITPFAYIGYLCWLAGTVCLVVWLLKRSGNM